MIFDEIDTGISGEVAEQVGQTMRALASHCQILAITHQPQIACQAHHHFRVSKQEEGERTITHIQKLEAEEHVREVATLMSGATLERIGRDQCPRADCKSGDGRRLSSVCTNLGYGLEHQCQLHDTALFESRVQ